MRLLFAQEVTPENFLNILQGNAEAVSGVGSGKVLRRWGSQFIIVNVKCLKLSFPCCSGPNDYVFVNFVDHGAPGIVAFPDDQVAELIDRAFHSLQ